MSHESEKSLRYFAPSVQALSDFFKARQTCARACHGEKPERKNRSDGAKQDEHRSESDAHAFEGEGHRKRTRTQCCARQGEHAAADGTLFEPKEFPRSLFDEIIKTPPAALPTFV